MRIVRPTTLESPLKRERHSALLRTTRFSPAWRSSTSNARPTAMRTRSVSKNPRVANAPTRRSGAPSRSTGIAVIRSPIIDCTSVV